MAKKAATKRVGAVRDFVEPSEVGGYAKMTRKRHAEITGHIGKLGVTKASFSDIIRNPPPRGKGGTLFKVYDDDIDDILAAHKAGWTVAALVILFKSLGRPLSYGTIQNVVKGRIEKGRGLRSDRKGS